MLQLIKLKSILFNRYTALAVIVVGSVLYHMSVVSSLKNDLDECKTKKDEITTQFNELSVASELQSSEIDRWFKANQTYSQVITEINAKNIEERKRFTVLLDRLKDAPIPQDCDGALRHLQSTVIELSDEWDKK